MGQGSRSECGCSAGGQADGGDLASTSKPTFSLAQVAANMLRGGELWSDATLTYSFYGSASYAPQSTGFKALTATQQAVAREALQLWSDVSGLRFVEVSGNASTIGFGNYNSTFNTPCGPFSGYAFGTGTGTSAGDIWINQDAASNADPSYGTTGFRRFVREIGHALDLSHPGAYDAGAGICEITYERAATYQQDTYQYTLMSYFNASNTGADILYGNQGDDTLIGGDGADVFVLADAAHAARARDYDPTEGDPLLILPDTTATLASDTGLF